MTDEIHPLSEHSYSVAIGVHPELGGGRCLGWGVTPRDALHDFWRRCWAIAIWAITEPHLELGWVERECMRLALEQQPLNWHRAVTARLGCRS